MKEKTIELGKVRQGERFKLDGVEFVKLDCDEEATFVLTADTLPECCAFEDDDAEREDHNNFSGSLIQKHMERFFREQHSPIFKAIVERHIDLTSMDGMTTYGKPFTVARLLTIDEFRKYRRFIPLTSKPFWTATPWTTLRSPNSYDYDAYYIDTDGTVDYDNVDDANFAPRPALYLKSSILVSVETEDEEKVLSDYTDTELMDELYRRRRATYDAG